MTAFGQPLRCTAERGEIQLARATVLSAEIDAAAVWRPREIGRRAIETDGNLSRTAAVGFHDIQLPFEEGVVGPVAPDERDALAVR